MPTTFRSIISELWASLGQEPPQFDMDDVIDLSSDDVSLRIEEYGDGTRLLVSAEIGALAADSMRRDEQIRKILQDNLGFLSSRRACVHLRSDSDEPPVLMVGGVHSYSESATALSALIEDVLFLHEWHRESLRDGAISRSSAVSERYEQHNVIFRP